MEPRDYFTLWVLSVLASATIVGGKIGMFVWGLAPDPPAEPTAAMHWRRRRPLRANDGETKHRW
jgi:hypothetical protein